ncbi:phenylalanyl-tRNA synthetase [Lepidopterella palustris CBS 459.81]|uniref:Phenylalanine--tRNA ligase, mitochondrial n=1 Tax=Lepidopterella palustris CBS 459.81 TaxID=1314670 RepID=A0A8E2JI03_9PEZI|nr:phenylalanyl-tRNA synthetase [Lepidopterella palustris CBS 459.81]
MRITLRASRSLFYLARSAKAERLAPGRQRCCYSSGHNFKDITIEGRPYKTDSWMNTPASILSSIPRRLHLQPDHPISLTRQLIESHFPGFTYHNDLFPIVSVAQNFDSLNFPPDHPGRSRTDTYYINRDTVLRTHTSAHQADTFRANENSGFLISADVYRRDAVDRSHYPVFHQMEGAKTWNRNDPTSHSTLAAQIWADVAALPTHSMQVSDPSPTIDPEHNPLQSAHHTAEEVEAMAAHLKRSLENVVISIFTAARAASASPSDQPPQDREPLQMRWVTAYFPFTSPSWELEVLWQDTWLEVLGCGIISHSILSAADQPSRLGWAFGVGLERIAMLLFSIPDIRLFWSKDPRFLSQFSAAGEMKRFVPFSKHPACFKDVSFWVKGTSSAAGGLGGSVSGEGGFHENDVMEIARDVAGDLVEDVRLVDEFSHPKTGRRSLCYRVNYRSLERTLTNVESNELHERFRQQLVERLGVELR